MQNTKVDRAFYTSNGRNLVIDSSYFELLPVGIYTFKAYGGASSYEFTVTVTAVSQTILQNVIIENGCNAVIYLGNINVDTVTLNGNKLSKEQYRVENFMLIIYADSLTQGTNKLVINGDKNITITVEQ